MGSRALPSWKLVMDLAAGVPGAGCQTRRVWPHAGGVAAVWLSLLVRTLIAGAVDVVTTLQELRSRAVDPATLQQLASSRWVGQLHAP